MNRFSAQYVLTNTGQILRRAIITTLDDGTITGINDTGGNLKESNSIQFYNGIIIPGFVNCHCHLELSHLKNMIAKGNGLGPFIQQIRDTRINGTGTIESSIVAADKEMYDEGVVLCADICNNADTFRTKTHSPIHYINLLEVFGSNPEKAKHRMEEIINISREAEKCNLPFSLVPHSVYSLSIPLFELLLEKTRHNQVTSIHFMESESEKEFTSLQHTDVILNNVTPSGNLILIHNTFIGYDTVKKVKQRGNMYFCVCPNSNLYIEKCFPPVALLREMGCEIVVGTDSLASNTHLSILSELKTLQQHIPSLTIDEMIRWATLNGAKALNESEKYGKIEPGMRPGLLVLQNVDLKNMKLLPDSFISRLI